ncbi:MAG: asparaginase [Calditrichaeota bacterium]|nr:MAG: asparaginase [Calditrichota bacterium]
MSAIVAEVVRNGRVESVHRGHLAVVTADGELVASSGEVTTRTYMRSTGKPFQVMPLLLSEAARVFGLTDKELAVMIASHNGEPFHLQAVASILQKAGLNPAHLRCGAHPPLDESSAMELVRQNQQPTALHNNCSGKHAGMLTLAAHLGAPLDTYLDPAHPVQVEIKAGISQFSGLPEEKIGVGIDGCSAPVFYLPMFNMARMYARLSQGELPPAARVFELMVQNPEMIAGSRRFDTAFMQVMRGTAVSKVGAEGVRCIGLRGEPPVGLALKIEDGARRATEPVVLEVLRQLHLISARQLEELSDFARPVLRNHAGLEVGTVRATVDLQQTQT